MSLTYVRNHFVSFTIFFIHMIYLQIHTSLRNSLHYFLIHTFYAKYIHILSKTQNVKKNCVLTVYLYYIFMHIVGRYSLSSFMLTSSFSFIYYYNTTTITNRINIIYCIIFFIFPQVLYEYIKFMLHAFVDVDDDVNFPYIFCFVVSNHFLPC